MSLSFAVNAHKYTDGRLFLTVCDKDLVGKKFTQGDLQLDLTSAYYKGEEKTAEQTLSLMKKAYSISFVGKLSIELAEQNRFIEPQNILRINGVPTAQCMQG